jgi:hypothetical protein
MSSPEKQQQAPVVFFVWMNDTHDGPDEYEILLEGTAQDKDSTLAAFADQAGSLAAMLDACRENAHHALAHGDGAVFAQRLVSFGVTFHVRIPTVVFVKGQKHGEEEA